MGIYWQIIGVIILLLFLWVLYLLKQEKKKVQYLKEWRNNKASDDSTSVSEKITKELDQKAFNLFILYEASKAISSRLDIDELMKLVMDMFIEVVGVTKGVILLPNNNSTLMTAEVWKGLDPEQVEKVKELTINIGENLFDWTKTYPEPIILSKLPDDDLFNIVFLDAKSQLEEAGFKICVPLIHKAKLVGLVVLGSKFSADIDFSQNDLDLMYTLSGLVANAMENVRLYALATLDGLTKVYVSRFFHQRLKEEVQRARRYNLFFSLIMLDIDHFKKYNDTYGHQQGDIVLRELGSLIKKNLREGTDLPARYGGEEFAIILPETDLDGAFIQAERIRKAVESHEFTSLKENEKMNVTISLGVANFPQDGSNGTELIEKADQALYRAKRNGRNRVCTTRDKETELQELPLITDGPHIFETAIFDEKTQLLKAPYLRQRIKEEIKRATRYQLNFTFIFLEIEHLDLLKKENPSVGNDLLLKFAKQIRNNLRLDIDLAAYYEGNIIAILLPETDANGSVCFVKRLKGCLDKVKTEENAEDIRFNFGIALFPANGYVFNELIEYAASIIKKARQSEENIYFEINE